MIVFIWKHSATAREKMALFVHPKSNVYVQVVYSKRAMSVEEKDTGKVERNLEYNALGLEIMIPLYIISACTFILLVVEICMLLPSSEPEQNENVYHDGPLWELWD